MIGVMPEEFESVEAWLVRVAGAYYVVPKQVVLNMKEQYECIKKAENAKTALPVPVLRYEQLVGMPHCVAAALLGE